MKGENIKPRQRPERRSRVCAYCGKKGQLNSVAFCDDKCRRYFDMTKGYKKARKKFDGSSLKGVHKAGNANRSHKGVLKGL